MAKKLKKMIDDSSPRGEYVTAEDIKYLKEKLRRYEEVVYRIISPMEGAGVPDEIIQTILDGKSIVSVFYDKNKIGRSVQNVDMRFTTKDVKKGVGVVMRLTKKDDLFSGGYEPLAPYCDVTAKLGKLEDIEEALGVDLIVKLRVEIAIANNIKKNKDTKVFCIGCDGSISEVSFYKFFPPCITVLSDVENQCFELRYKDYGKTWALTREELS